MVKNRPMDSTVAEFWKVFSMPGARAALVRRQAVHDRGLVGREEQAHADREQEDEQREPDVAEVDRQQFQQQEGRAGDDQPGRGEQPGAVAVGQHAGQRADDQEPDRSAGPWRCPAHSGVWLKL